MQEADLQVASLKDDKQGLAALASVPEFRVQIEEAGLGQEVVSKK